MRHRGSGRGARGAERRRAPCGPRAGDGRAARRRQEVQLRDRPPRHRAVVGRRRREPRHAAHGSSGRRGKPRSLADHLSHDGRPAPDARGAGRRQLRRAALRSAAGLPGRERAERSGAPRPRRRRDAAPRPGGPLLRQRRAVHAARSGRANRADLEPELLRRALRARLQEPTARRRQPRLRHLRGRADRRHLSSRERVESRVHRGGRRRGARLLPDRGHAEGDRVRVHRADGPAGGPAGVGVRALGFDLLRPVHDGLGARDRAPPSCRRNPLRRLPPGFVLAARPHVVRLRVGQRADPGSQAPSGRAAPRGVPQLSVDQPLRVAPERGLSRGRHARLLPAPSRRQRLSPGGLEPAHRAWHGSLRHRRLHEPGRGGVVPRQARGAARARRRFVQARLRGGNSRRRGVRQRADRCGDAQPVSAALPEGSLRRDARSREPRGGVVAQRGAGRPALSGPLVGRLGVHVPRPGEHAARRAGGGDERPGLLEPRHRRLLGRSVSRPLRALGAGRFSLGAQPLSRRDGA